MDRKRGSVSTLSDLSPGDDLTLTALGLEGSGLPAVHGFIRAEAGEFTLAEMKEGALIARRDAAGTRPLYVGRTGGWVASDHRFFPGEEFEILPPGAAYSISNGRRSVQGSNAAQVPADFEEASQRLARLIEKSVAERVKGLRRVAIAFSGGLDSSILARCASRHAEVIGCCVFAKNSRDEMAAESAARKLEIGFSSRTVERDDLVRNLSSLDLPFEPTSMDRALWCIYSIASEMAAREGSEVILLGQLADELFGGYRKYAAALTEKGPRAAEGMMAADVAGCAKRGFVRDEIACSRRSEPRFPFADESILSYGLACPVDFKIRPGSRKAILRRAGVILGLDEELATEPKKAAQYSSGLLKLLD